MFETKERKNKKEATKHDIRMSILAAVSLFYLCGYVNQYTKNVTLPDPVHNNPQYLNTKLENGELIPPKESENLNIHFVDTGSGPHFNIHKDVEIIQKYMEHGFQAIATPQYSSYYIDPESDIEIPAKGENARPDGDWWLKIKLPKFSKSDQYDVVFIIHRALPKEVRTSSSPRSLLHEKDNYVYIDLGDIPLNSVRQVLIKKRVDNS